MKYLEGDKSINLITFHNKVFLKDKKDIFKICGTTDVKRAVVIS